MEFLVLQCQRNAHDVAAPKALNWHRRVWCTYLKPAVVAKVIGSKQLLHQWHADHMGGSISTSAVRSTVNDLHVCV